MWRGRSARQLEAGVLRVDLRKKKLRGATDPHHKEVENIVGWNGDQLGYPQGQLVAGGITTNACKNENKDYKYQKS